MKIHTVGAELFYAEGQTDRQAGRQADRQTDMTKLIDTFCNFAKMSKNLSYPWISLIMVLFKPCIFLKTSFHSGGMKGMYVCACVCVYLANCLPQNDVLYTHHGQPLQSYSMPSTRIRLKMVLFS